MSDVYADDKCKKVFTFFIIFSQIASTVKSPISFLDMGEVTLIVAFLYLFFIRRIGESRIFTSDSGWNMLVLFILFMIITAIDGMCITSFSNQQVFIRGIRWLFYIIMLIFASTFFDYSCGRKAIYMFSWLSVCILYIQIFCYKIMGIILSVPFQGRILGCNIEYINSGGKIVRVYRFSSLFREPSHMTYFVALAISLYLFETLENSIHLKNCLLKALVMTLGLLLTTSSYACLLLCIIWCWFLAIWWMRKPYITPLILIGVVLILLLLFFLIKTDGIWWNYLMHKIRHLGSTKRTTFLGGNLKYLPGLRSWLGVGVGNEEYYLSKEFGIKSIWLNSISITFYYCGYLGLIILALFYCFQYFNTKTEYRLLVLLCMAMTIFSGDFYGKYLITYFAIIDNFRHRGK